MLDIFGFGIAQPDTIIEFLVHSHIDILINGSADDSASEFTVKTSKIASSSRKTYPERRTRNYHTQK
jgi:hypothetical protein